MIDILFILLLIAIVMFSGYGILELFRWGYNKEKRNERTDLWGRPNNNMSKDDMD